MHANSAENKDVGLIKAVGLALQASGYSALRTIEVSADRGVVVLKGRVPSYFQKQLAQTAAQRENGGRRISNELQVVSGR